MTARHLSLALVMLACSAAALAQRSPATADAVASPFQDFADAAVACAEAAQAAGISSVPVEQRGWTSYAQAPDIEARATTFSRKGDHVLITILKSPPQCGALWFVTSPSGPDAIFSHGDEAVAAALKSVFSDRFAAADAQTGGGNKLHRFRVGDAVLLFTVEPSGPGAVLRLAAMNKNYDPRNTSPASR